MSQKVGTKWINIASRDASHDRDIFDFSSLPNLDYLYVKWINRGYGNKDTGKGKA